LYAGQNANAETYYIYVEKMPQHWQKQFGGVLDGATKYWSQEVSGAKFETVQFIDKSDFVVQWSSNQENGLGYYSEDTANFYGKPTVTVTLGFFEDQKLKMLSYDQALQLTKHELGHAIGMQYTDNPDDIMYPTIEDQESLQYDISVSVPANGDLEQISKKYQKLVEEKLMHLQPHLAVAQQALSLESSDDSWMVFWWAKKYLADSERLSTEGGASILQSDFEDSYTKFKTAYEYTLRAEQKLLQIVPITENTDQ
jgi:hypothetical protein